MDVDGVGTIRTSGTTDSGLVLVSTRDESYDMVRGNLLVVRELGLDPPWGWHTHCAGTGGERTWPAGTWREQEIRRGTVIAVRAVAGLDQGSDARFVQIRYDEVAAIGAPRDEPDDAPAMYPAPGWVLLRMERDEADDTTDGGIYVGSERRDIFANNGIAWGSVYALPRGWSGEMGVRVGSRVGVPRWNAHEYLELEDGAIRAHNWGDVLVIDDSRGGDTWSSDLSCGS